MITTVGTCAAGAVCAKCPAGSYAPTQGSTEVSTKFCLDLLNQPGDQLSPIRLMFSTFSSLVHGIRICTGCSITIAFAVVECHPKCNAVLQCLSCPVGTYNPVTGASTCTLCPRGAPPRYVCLREAIVTRCMFGSATSTACLTLLPSSVPAVIH